MALAKDGYVRDEPRETLHRILADILSRDDGGRRIYGDEARVRTEDAIATLERVRDAGAGMVAELLPEYADDLRAYSVNAPRPLEGEILGRRVLTTPAPSLGGEIVLAILRMLEAAGDPSLHDEARAVAVAYGEHAHGPLPGTTHVSVIDDAGMAAALSSTLGSGSGVFRGGTQLNNMLGELDVIGPHEKAPGDRLSSMMTPTLVLRSGRAELVIGSAGSVRLAGAIAQVIWRILRWSTHVSAAIRAPRIHADGSTLHLEGGWADHAAEELASDWAVVRWDALNLFFGGVQAVQCSDGVFEAAGDPRRGGSGLVVP